MGQQRKFLISFCNKQFSEQNRSASDVLVRWQVKTPRSTFEPWVWYEFICLKGHAAFKSLTWEIRYEQEVPSAIYFVYTWDRFGDFIGIDWV